MFSTVTAGTPARFSASAMKRSPGPISCSPFSTNSAASASASARSTWRCMRSVSASRGRCTPGRSTSTSCQSSPVAMPRISRRVVCGLSETIATFPPTIRFTSVDLPAFGRPGQRHEAGAAHSVLQHAALEREHLAVVRLVVVAAQVEHAVHHGLGQVLGVLRADHHVAQLARPGRRAALVHGEGQHVGGPVDAAVLAVQRADPLRVHELDREVAVLDAGRGERGQRGSAQLLGHVDEVELDQRRQPCWRRAWPGAAAGPASRRTRCRRPRCAARACGAPRPRRRSARTRCPRPP